MWRRILLEASIVTVQTVALIGLCATFGIPRSDPKAESSSSRPLGLDLYRPEPADNPVTPDKVQLGQRLFREKLLSRDRSIACDDCHQPKRAFADRRAKAVGVYGRKGPRSVPTLINRAWGESFFWDGRTSTLEEQVVMPIQAETEMDLTLDQAVARLSQKRRYRSAFAAVFEREPNPDDLAYALAAYVRTILAGDSRYDRYLFGKPDALSARELAGLRLFQGKANCSVCHSGPLFSDEQFHNTGVAWKDRAFLDEGRALVTDRADDRGKFKTPTLREVTRTAPYMHDGSLGTLRDVVDFYNDGGRANPNLDEDIRKLNLSEQEKAQLIAFLRTLSGAIKEGRTSRLRQPDDAEANGGFAPAFDGPYSRLFARMSVVESRASTGIAGDERSYPFVAAAEGAYSLTHAKYARLAVPDQSCRPALSGSAVPGSRFRIGDSG